MIERIKEKLLTTNPELAFYPDELEKRAVNILLNGEPEPITQEQKNALRMIGLEDHYFPETRRKAKRLINRLRRAANPDEMRESLRHWKDTVRRTRLPFLPEVVLRGAGDSEAEPTVCGQPLPPKLREEYLKIMKENDG